MKSKTKWLTAITTLAVVFVLVLSLGLSSVFASAADDEATSVRYYSDYDTKDQADEAVAEMNMSLEEEGIVMLKNDGALPLSTSLRVSVFGLAQDTFIESEGSVTESLENAGFVVNPALESFYASDGAKYTDFGSEPDLGTREIESLKSYNDVGVVVIGRGEPGESSIEAEGVSDKEQEEYVNGDQGWKHEETLDTYTYKDNDGNYHTLDEGPYKHGLELTDSEVELIKLAEDNCKKVVVLYSGEQVFEMANLENDSAIDGILWIGRPGYGGMDAIGEVLSGAVNPSGKTVDEWTRDLTNDPTYANAVPTDYTYTVTGSDGEGGTTSTEVALAGNSTDVNKNYNGLDYEEDIYYGYKFYETYWREGGYGVNLTNGKVMDAQDTSGDPDGWYDANVVYPFGYGLSYTSFSYDLQSVTTNLGADITQSGQSSLSADTLSTSKGDVYKNQSSEKIVSMTASVNVTNTGSVAGKETVQVYVEAPYESGKIEKPYYTLVGFGKTEELKPGASETIDITFNVQDFASYDYANANSETDGHCGYELDLGSYNIHVMESSSHENIPFGESYAVSDIDENNAADKSNAYECCTFSIVAGTTNQSAAHLDADDWSGNEVSNVFSDPEDDYYSMAMSAASGTMISPLDVDEAEPASADGTTTTMFSRSDFDGTWPKAPESASLGNQAAATAVQTGLLEKYQSIDADDYDDSEDPWYISADDLSKLSGWTQGAGTKSGGLYGITLDDMGGVSLDDDKWVDFMNQLTWDEMCSLLNDAYHMTVSIASIGKVETLDENGPNMVPNGKNFVGTPIRSATWNQELLYQSGVVAGSSALMNGATGYYGPGVNTHRSPFGGRTAEYFSQDGIQAGYMASAFCSGMSSRGILIYVKHFALNDYGLPSNSTNLCANVSEQNMRENYLKPFQMCMQEGECRGAMTSLGRIGGIWCGQNYALQQTLAKDEWGWSGCFITDTIAMLPYMTADGLVRTSGNLPDGNFSTTTVKDENDEDVAYGVLSGTWSGSYDWTKDTTYGTVATGLGDNAPVGAVTFAKTSGSGASATTTNVASPTQWYCVRTAAMQVLYNVANSAANYNGVTSSQISSQSKTVPGVMQGATLNSYAIVTDALIDRVSYSEVTSGTVPEGMYVEAGTVYGKPTVSGRYDFTVVSYVDYWIPLTSNVTIEIASCLNVLAAEGVDPENEAVGESISFYIVADEDNVFTTNAGEDWTFSYSITDGSLPSGLTLNESTGRITGTPTAAGTYTFTITLTATDLNGYQLILDDRGTFAYESLLSYGWFEMDDYVDPDLGPQEGGKKFINEDGSLKTGEFCLWILGGGKWGTMAFSTYMLNSIYEPEAQVYSLTYTITVSDGVLSDDSSSSSSSGMAIAVLVLAIVAILAAAAVCVIVLLKRNNNGGGSSSDKGEGSDGDRPAVD